MSQGLKVKSWLFARISQAPKSAMFYKWLQENKNKVLLFCKVMALWNEVVDCATVWSAGKFRAFKKPQPPSVYRTFRHRKSKTPKYTLRVRLHTPGEITSGWGEKGKAGDVKSGLLMIYVEMSSFFVCSPPSPPFQSKVLQFGTFTNG
jgi:hypothetical protein